MLSTDNPQKLRRLNYRNPRVSRRQLYVLLLETTNPWNVYICTEYQRSRRKTEFILNLSGLTVQPPHSKHSYCINTCFWSKINKAAFSCMNFGPTCPIGIILPILLYPRILNASESFIRWCRHFRSLAIRKFNFIFWMIENNCCFWVMNRQLSRRFIFGLNLRWTSSYFRCNATFINLIRRLEHRSVTDCDSEASVLTLLFHHLRQRKKFRILLHIFDLRSNGTQ